MEQPGIRLKKIRLERGISLEDVQKKTKINLKVLKAIEGDSITNLSPVYLKSFLKIYCGFLGLDPKGYLAEYKEAPPRQPPAAAPAKNAAAIRLNPPYPAKKIMAVFAIALAAVFLFWGLFNLGKFASSKSRMRRPSLITAKKPEAKGLKQQKPKDASGAAKTAAGENRPLKEVSSGIKLGIRAKENCWVSLKADGRVLFQGVLEKGRLESWSAKDKIEISLGNAGAVEMEVNGQIFSNFGKKGQARKNIVITKDGLNIGR